MDFRSEMISAYRVCAVSDGAMTGSNDVGSLFRHPKSSRGRSGKTRL